MNDISTDGYLRVKEVFPAVDISAYDWIEDMVCFNISHNSDKALCYPFKGGYIQLTFVRDRLPNTYELVQFQSLLESQIGCKTDCTGTPEKCGGPHAIYHLPLFVHKVV